MTEENKDAFWDEDSSFQSTTDDNDFELDPGPFDDREEESEEEEEENDVEETSQEENEESDNDEESNEEDSGEKEDPLFQQSYELFKDNVFQYLPEDYEFKSSEKGFADAIQKVEESLIDRVHNKYLSNLQGNENASKFLDFLVETEGNGDFERWKDNNINNNFTEEDLSNEDNQAKIVSRLYELQGYDKEDIATKVEDLEDLGLLEKEAKIALKQINKSRDQVNEELVEDGRNVKQREREVYENNMNILSETLNETKYPTKRRQAIVDTIMKPLELEGGGTITMYDYKLNQIKSNPDHIIELTNFLLNYDIENGFDLENIAKKRGNTQVTKSLREKLEEMESSSTISKSRSNKSRKIGSKQGPDLSEISFKMG
jgi:hypothetical protein